MKLNKMVSEIRGHVLTIGKRGPHNLSIANAQVEKYLQHKLRHEPLGYTGTWNHNSTTTYHTHFPYLSDARDSNIEIEVYDHPAEFSEGFRLEPDRFEGQAKYIAKVSGKLGIVLASKEFDWGTSCVEESKIVTAKRIYKTAHEVFTAIKRKEHEIVPGREMVFLMDNGYNFFTAQEFARYLHQEKKCPGHAVTSDLCEDLHSRA